MLKSTCRKHWCLCACKKSTSSLTFFLRYCKGITNFLFGELWECLTITIKIIVSISSMLSCLSARKKNQLPHLLFLTILQRNSKLVILVKLRMPGHTHLKWQYHFEETFEVYQQAKNQLHSFTFSLRYCKDIVNLLFWVLWACLAKYTQSDIINL